MYLDSNFQRPNYSHPHLRLSCKGIKKIKREKINKQNQKIQIKQANREWDITNFLLSNITEHGCKYVSYTFSLSFQLIGHLSITFLSLKIYPLTDCPQKHKVAVYSYLLFFPSSIGAPCYSI